MCLSPFLVVSLDTATMRIGSLAGSNPRLGDKHRSEEHTSELQSPCNLVCRLLLEKKNDKQQTASTEEHMQRRRLTLPRTKGPFCARRSLLSNPSAIGMCVLHSSLLLLFFNDTATTEIYTLSLHDALPIYREDHCSRGRRESWRSDSSRR